MDIDTKRTIVILISWVLAFLLGVVVAMPNQTQPDPKRIRQIQVALIEHGYPSTTSWAETRSVLEAIAKSHRWQTHHVPDARVLILLGLGNEHSDPEVLKW